MMTKPHRWFNSKWLTGALVVLAAALFFSVSKSQLQLDRLRTEQTNAQNRLQALRDSVIDSNDLVSNSSQESLSLLAKQKLGYKEPGENVVVVVHKGQNRAVPEDIVMSVAERESNLQRWMRYTFGN